MNQKQLERLDETPVREVAWLCCLTVVPTIDFRSLHLLDFDIGGLLRRFRHHLEPSRWNIRQRG